MTQITTRRNNTLTLTLNTQRQAITRPTSKTSKTPRKIGNQADVADTGPSPRLLNRTDTTYPNPEPTRTYPTTDGRASQPKQLWMVISTKRKATPKTEHPPRPSNMPEQPQNTPQRPLLIRQQNVNKFLLSQLDLLESLKRDEYDICVIQEPYIDFNGKSRANRQWITLYPSTHQEHPDSTRSVTLINTNLSTDAWKQIKFQHPDITAFEIQGPFGTLRIINIYNDCNNNSALTHVSNFMRDRENQLQAAAPIHTIWLGDFNRHHPLWDEERNAHLFTRGNLELTQPLLNMLGRHNMKMALPPFTPTLCAHNSGNFTRVDNVFCTESIMDAIIKCDTDEATRPVKTDHFPIITQIDIHAPKATWTPRRNFRLADWPELIKTLNENLANIPVPTEIHDINTFNQKLEALNGAIQSAIEKHVKLTTPSPYSKRWWSSELAKEKKLMQQLGKQSKYHREHEHHPAHERYRKQRNKYSESIQKAKAEHWAEWLENINQTSIWQASRLITSPASDAGKARIPTLQIKDPRTNRVTREATDNASKGRLFHETFFPPPNPETSQTTKSLRPSAK
jgi:hypothetical protein